MDKKASAFIVTKNADFTEGRGPMVHHAVFKDPREAHAYVMLQQGIFGSQQPDVDFSVQREKMTEPYGASYNGYDIKETVYADADYREQLTYKESGKTAEQLAEAVEQLDAVRQNPALTSFQKDAIEEIIRSSKRKLSR